MSGASDHVALILVSHSRMLAEGVAALARQMTGDTVTIICAAGMGDNGDEIGTDAMRILEALTEADHPAGCSITLLKLDDEMVKFWDAPVVTPSLRWGA